MIVVLDTNILVSAMLSPFGPPARVLDLVLAGELLIAWDDRLLNEYREVLARPRFGFDLADVTALLSFITESGMSVIAPPLALSLPDPDDAMFIEVATVAQAILVTGNTRHFPIEQRGAVTALTPAEFIAAWGKGQS